MSTEFEPIRAWGEYDEWSLFALYQPHPNVWDLWLSPKAGEGEPWCVSIRTDLADALPESPGPLRSLRVLLRSGHEVTLTRKSGPITVPQGRNALALPPGCVTYSLHDADGGCCFGAWLGPETTDTDAVTRALSEAQVWLAGRRTDGGEDA